MQKTILAALAVVASVSAASATDLPSKTTTPAAPAVSQSTNYYVGVNAGTLGTSTSVYSGGAVAGWNALPFLAVEGAYTYNYYKDDSAKNTHTFAVNALPQYRVSFIPVSFYALGGAGYRIDKVNADHAIYNYGAGAKYSLNTNIDIDARYTRTTAFDTEKYTGNEDRYTIGLNYKF